MLDLVQHWNRWEDGNTNAARTLRSEVLGEWEALSRTAKVRWAERDSEERWRCYAREKTESMGTPPVSNFRCIRKRRKSVETVPGVLRFKSVQNWIESSCEIIEPFLKVGLIGWRESIQSVPNTGASEAIHNSPDAHLLAS